MTAISVEDAVAILADRNVIAVGARGDDERRRRHGASTTFVRVFEVHTEAIPPALPLAMSAGEVRVTGKPSSVAAAIESVKAARAIAGTVPVTAYSLADLVALAGGSIAGLTDLAGRLAAAGLSALAEAPLDLLVSVLPIDNAAVETIRAARTAGLEVPRLTVQHPADEPLRLVALARDVQSAAGGVRAFAPLPRVQSIAQPTTGYDDVRLIAVTRLVVDNVDSIQVDWALYGPKLAQVALTMGADDVDGVSPFEGDLGRRRSPLEEIRGNITAAGLEPVERDGRFQRRA
jgi:aminodeoxyfutalosine synthase